MEGLTQDVMQSYGFGLEDDLDAQQLQVIHADLRMGGISKQQVKHHFVAIMLK